jgi:hypothetical protein
MNIEQKIFYYKETKWNIPFRELHHTVVTVCEWVKFICPNIQPLKYIKYFFTEIDFDKIENNTNKAETLKYCNAIYYGLEQLLKADISNAILDYQMNISKQTKEQIQETQIKLVELIGNLKRQARTCEAGISFTQRYNALYKSIETKESLVSIDYQILISHFNETIINDLLSSFEIINETFKEITPLLKALPPQPIVKQKPELKIDQIALKYAYEGLQITRENGNEIAKEYGHNSGEKLFQRFTYFSSSANRKGKPNLCTPKKLDNKIKLIESIIELLPTDKQERAKDEVSILKKIYEAEYQ